MRISNHSYLYTRYIIPSIVVHNMPEEVEISITFWKWCWNFTWEKD